MSVDVFGPGILYLTRTDLTPATPVNVGYAQEFSLEFNANVKELYGQNQFPLDTARGAIKVTGKAKAAVISGLAWNAAFFGNNFATGGFKWNVGEAGTVPAAGPYTVTVSNSATFDQDLGVVFAATGLPLTKVASGPTTGQYSVAAGVYTFAAADTAKAVLITYTSTVTTGQQLMVSNQLLGISPIFQLDYYTSRNNKPLVLRLFQAQASKLSLAFKLEDFMMPELDFGCFANAAGNVANLVFPEVS